MQQSEFVQTYGPLANDVSSRTGMDANVVLGIIGQETGWGNHVVGSNIFGISPGGNVAGYKDVPSAADAFVSLINSRYKDVSKASPDQQPYILSQLGYNRNPGYADSVSRIATQARALLGPSSMPANAPDYNTPSSTPSTPPNASPANTSSQNDDPVSQVIRKLQARPAVNTDRSMQPDPEKPEIAGGYVSSSGDYVPPQAVPGTKPNPKASPLVSSTTNENPTEAPADLFASPFDQRYTPFNLLPMATNNQTGQYALALPGVISSPLNSWAQMGNRLFQPYSPDSLKSVTPEQFTSLAPGARPFGAPVVTLPPTAARPGAATPSPAAPPPYSNPNLHLSAPPEGQTPLNSKGWYLPPEGGPAPGGAGPSPGPKPGGGGAAPEAQPNPAPPNMTADDVSRISKTIANIVQQNARGRVIGDLGDAAARTVIHTALGPLGSLGEIGYNLAKHYIGSRSTARSASQLQNYLQNELSRYLPKE